VADPTAAVLSLALMLEHLGEEHAAAAVESAVLADLNTRGIRRRSTAEIGDALVDNLG
jgi:3-isopropylmalate dehydrogenase